MAVAAPEARAGTGGELAAPLEAVDGTAEREWAGDGAEAPGAREAVAGAVPALGAVPAAGAAAAGRAATVGGPAAGALSADVAAGRAGPGEPAGATPDGVP
ncbi:MAG TPA: hypothetical protein VK425_06185 [Acidimicrobiales bacterium]|nr:hypothetical protein [Acidimicrobiales bacterium]